MELVWCGLFALGLGIWRRWFGGGFGKLGDITRGFKYALLAVLMGFAYWSKDIFDWQNWKMYANFLAFCVFWAIAHGGWFVVNDSSNGGEGRCPLIDKMLFLTFGVEQSRTFAGNCSGMLIRYTLTALLVAIFSSGWFCMAGFIVASVYGVCGKKWPEKPYTNYAEFFSGLFVGLLLWFCL